MTIFLKDIYDNLQKNNRLKCNLIFMFFRIHGKFIMRFCDLNFSHEILPYCFFIVVSNIPFCSKERPVS